MGDKQEMTDPKELAGIFKKSGMFDKQRRKLIDNFKSSETHNNLLLKLKLMIDNKVKNDPSILMKNKGKMGALIQGEIISDHNKDANSLLSIVDRDIQEKIIDSPEFRASIKNELRDIKRKQEGVSDEEYKEILKQEQEQEQKEKEQQKDQQQRLFEDYHHPHSRWKPNESNHKFNHNRVMKAPKFNLFSNDHSDPSHDNSNNNSSNSSNSNPSTKKEFSLKY